MTSTKTRDWLQEAREWIASDPDPATRGELQELIDSEDTEALKERLIAPLAFGTAGLRGIVGAGPGRMNLVTVARASAGLAMQLLASVPEATTRGVVVGRDARNGSDRFARVAAEIFAGHGLPVKWVAGPNPTPVVAFIGRHLGCAGAVVVTASHNPPAYNGYKVYSARGAQIVSDQADQIRAARDGLGAFATLPRVAFADACASGLIEVVADADLDAYLDAIDAQCTAETPPAQVRVVTTALHGVGHAWVEAALARRGHHDRHPVRSQQAPDPGFSTVVFPNPEEDGALDRAELVAARVEADVIVANDPDTDRLCVAARDGDAMTKLSGNELGVLLADWLLSERTRHATLPPKPLVVTTIVSTMMLQKLAEARQARYADVLTGFKWIWDKALADDPDGRSFVFGFEEALGYCVGGAVRDKDGIGAAQVLMELAASEKAKGRTLFDRLHDLYRELGAYASDQVAIVLPGLSGKARIGRVMQRLRDAPPTEIAGARVTTSRDLQGPDADALGLPRSNVLTFWLADGSRVVCRPSGTEPKLKCYLEARADVVGTDTRAALEQARRRISELAETMRALIEATP